MKKEFRIEYAYAYGIEHVAENWKKYPHEPIPYIEVADANIYFYINENLLKNPKWLASTTDWILYYCLGLSQAVLELKEKKTAKVSGGDNPLDIEFKMEGVNIVHIKFLHVFLKEEKISYKGFAEGVLELLDKFLKDVDSINPELYKIDAFKKIKENREKIRQILKKLNEK